MVRFASILRALRGSMDPPFWAGGHLLGGDTATRATYVALLHGSSLRLGLCCPESSSLNRPDPSHSQAHHNFIARRLICDAFAVRERLGDLRLVPRFRCLICPNMSFPTSPGSRRCIYPVPSRHALAFAGYPTARHSRYHPFRGLLIHHCYDLLSCLPPFRRLLLPSFQRLGHPPRCRI